MLGKRNAGLILAAFGTVAASAAGYLKVVGPSPLRFESASDAQAPLPPLAPPDTSETQSTNTVAAAEAQVPSKPLASPPKIITTIAPAPATGASQLQATTTENSSSLTPASPESNSYTAHMLLQFFQQQSGRTNAVNTSVVAPLNFTLPPGGTTPSSSATYIQQ